MKHNNKQKPKPWYLKPSFYIWVGGTILFIAFLVLISKDKTTNAIATVDETSYSWGDIPIQGGNVEHDFTIKNEGTEPLKIYPMVTSCHCTNAQLITSEETGPLYTMVNDRSRDNSWRGEIKPGEEGTIRVIFDPIYHGDNVTGPITRTIDVRTSDRNFEFRVDGNVIPGDSLVSVDLGYENITPQQLKTKLDNSDTFLLDVHIPEQTHIDGTDQFIDYTQISENIDKLPEDKNTEIVVYCRSGSMSKQASEELSNLGYTNIKNLEGGVIGWKDAGYSVK